MIKLVYLEQDQAEDLIQLYQVLMNQKELMSAIFSQDGNYLDLSGHPTLCLPSQSQYHILWLDYYK